MMTKLENRQLNWFGHIARMNPERIVLRVVETGKIKRIKRDRP